MNGTGTVAAYWSWKSGSGIWNKWDRHRSRTGEVKGTGTAIGEKIGKGERDRHCMNGTGIVVGQAPEWTEDRRSRGAGPGWAARRNNEWYRH